MKYLLIAILFIHTSNGLADEFRFETLDIGIVKSTAKYEFQGDDDFDLSIETNNKSNLEFATIVNTQLISLKLPLESQEDNPDVAKTTGYDFNYQIGLKKYLLQLSYQQYKGYNVKNIGEGKKNKRIDLKSEQYHLSWTYFFKEDFNITKSYFPLLKRLRPEKTGSWLIKNSVTHLTIKGNEALNSDISGITNETIQEISLSNKIVFSTIAVSAGYYYVDRFWKNFSYSASLALGLGNQVIKTTENVLNHTSSTNTLELGIGYNTSTALTGLRLKSLGHNTNLDDDSFKSTTTTVNVFYRMLF